MIRRAFSSRKAGPVFGHLLLSLVLAGLISVAFGVVLCARPHMGAITLALLFGLFNLIAGIWMVVQGIELRRTGKTLDSAFPESSRP
jgi:uncharacterized membrane protein HdeD (DUF308 family)